MLDGAPTPLGVHLVAGGANIAIPAPGAEALDLCLFQDGHETRLRLPARTGDVFHGFVAGLEAGAHYGLRADGGPLLLDPWARRLDRHFAPGVMPLGVLEAPLPPALPPPCPGAQVIYELHVRGFSMQNPAVPPELRGTFAGLGHPASVEYLRRLGVTHVEVMPAAAWADERHLAPLGLGNYWGYNPVGWLAPDPRLAPGGMAEVRAAVAALAEAGIGVILDVVLNHSGEGDELGPVLSLKGLGDTAWYREAGGRYVNDAGCGNILALDRPLPLRLAMDAMRHWIEQAGLAGLRLDLATTLARRAEGFDPDAPLIQAMRQDPVLARSWIIAEPWDIGPGGYRLGEFPPGWGEWNDRFRDDVRRFWRGDEHVLGEFATRLAGSRDVFGGRSSAESVNYVTAHDGFTLADLVSHAHKHNAANGEDNRDGTDDNISWNHGIEGPSEDLRERRAADARALLATLLAARGTPMLSMGDEAGRSQQGNNNAWCQDGPISWFDWADADAGLTDFVARLVAARRAHPALHAVAPLRGEADADGEHDAEWFGLDGAPMDWHAHNPRSLCLVLHAAGDRVAVVVHGGWEPAALTLPPARTGWELLADSADPARTTLPDMMAPRSVLWLAEAPARRVQGAPDAALLAELAQAAGIATSWHDVEGQRHVVPAETLHTLLPLLGLPAATTAQARDSLARRRALPRAMPPEAGICHPPPPGRHWALMAQAFAQRHARDQGIGDYTALAMLAARAPGAALIGLSPPHALMPVERERASPYQPSDRRFLEPVLLDVTALDGVADALNATEPVFAALRRGELVDYTAVWAAKRPVLEAAFRASPDAGRAPGKALADFAAFNALSDRFGPRHRWPAGFAHPGDVGMAAFREQAAEDIRFHVFLQELCDRQLGAAAAAGPGLYRDLAIGAAPDGAEVWSQPSLFLPGFSIGAPPDPMGPLGQIWGLPVPAPDHAEAGLSALLAANMRHARALRLDHAMGIERLFVIPEGAPASAGCYLRYDGPAMLAALARESRAARCAVVGEALGTVPKGFPERLAAAQVLAYRVLWFEREGTDFLPPEEWPEFAAGCVSTHDLPPLAGWWEGADIAEAEALGLPASATRAEDRAALASACGIADGPYTPEVAAAVHGFVAGTPTTLMLVQAEDLAGETIGVNLPGTDTERPNWRRRLSVPAEALFETPVAQAIVGALGDRVK
jgi:glycogen operon protein